MTIDRVLGGLLILLAAGAAWHAQTLVVPFAAAAPCLVLLTRSAIRAWGAVGATTAIASIILWSSFR